MEVYDVYIVDGGRIVGVYSCCDEAVTAAIVSVKNVLETGYISDDFTFGKISADSPLVKSVLIHRW